MRASTRRAIDKLRAELSASEFAVFLADVRASTDEDMLGVDMAKPVDPTLTAVTALLAPFPQKSAEKAKLLAAHLEKLVGRTLPIKARGLPGAVRALRAHLSEDDIRDGAFSLRVTLAEAKTSEAHRKDQFHG